MRTHATNHINAADGERAFTYIHFNRKVKRPSKSRRVIAERNPEKKIDFTRLEYNFFFINEDFSFEFYSM